MQEVDITQWMLEEEKPDAHFLLQELFSENNLFKKCKRLQDRVNDIENLIQFLITQELPKIQIDDQTKDFFNFMSKKTYIKGDDEA